MKKTYKKVKEKQAMHACNFTVKVNFILGADNFCPHNVKKEYWGAWIVISRIAKWDENYTEGTSLIA